jgi:hypothetical protein
MSVRHRDGTPLPTTAKEWRALPELPLKQISNERETGNLYSVIRVGIYPARFQEVREIGIETPTTDGMMPLPTITVDLDGKPSIFRLPVELNSWAYDQVALAQSGVKLFPCRVEFGIIRGRPYAEFVIN